ncbi:MAG TPA: response regulator [Anaeromyxobacter sp.]|nr:response regulator [Anaeromyxobacter sp.]
MGTPGARSVLIVDDEVSIVEALSEILTWEGFSVSTAGNGSLALEELARNTVDVVLMDVMMPVMGGLDAAQRMNADPRTAHIPVVLMTAGPVPEGFDGSLVVRKPFELAALLRVLRRALERRQAAG